MSMITYEALRKAVNDEKASPKLSKLPDGFFQQVRDYIDKKSKAGEDWEITSAKRLLQDLQELREKKVILFAFYGVRTGVRPENMTEEESQLYVNVEGAIKTYQKRVAGLLEAKREDLSIVAIVSELPRFVGVDMREYGPFKAGDVATVPRKNAELLVNKGAAKELRIQDVERSV